jgi:hypothetical protein
MKKPLKEEGATMASGRFRCRIGWHEWAQKRSEDGQPLILAGPRVAVPGRA